MHVFVARHMILSAPPTLHQAWATEFPFLIPCQTVQRRASQPLLLQAQRSVATSRRPRTLSVVHRVYRAARTTALSIAVFVFSLLLSVPLSTIPPAHAEPAVGTEVAAAGLPAIAQMLPEGMRQESGADQRAPSALSARSTARRQKTSFVTSAVNSVGPAVVRIDTERKYLDDLAHVEPQSVPPPPPCVSVL